MTPNDKERYPIGQSERLRTAPDATARAALVDAIAEAPSALRSLVEPLTDAQLDWRYRDGGWTIRQVVHHVPDSHMNAYVRIKLAATQDAPAINAYDEARWAEMVDVRSVPLAVSLALLEALHQRWVAFLRGLTDADLRRPYIHPEQGVVPIYNGLAYYAWHGRHHAAHVRQALQRAGVCLP